VSAENRNPPAAQIRNATPDPMQETILVLNSGSSSLKAGLFAQAPGVNFADERAQLSASVTGLGKGHGKLSVEESDGRPLTTEEHSFSAADEALQAIARVLATHGCKPAALGHRLVHGGPHFREPVRLTQSVVAILQRSIHYAPLHLPASLRLIETAARLYPGTPQFACFDTAFHATMPPEATRLPIPEEFAAEGVQRYGFHGLSYESLIAQLRFSGEPLPERIICAHLGGGSSVCAILRGRSIDTTMGLTPTGGITMATRTGDLDPGVLLFLARAKGQSLDALESLVNTQSGLTAICGTGDMQAIQAMRAASKSQRLPSDAHNADLAFTVYTTGVAKAIAALTVSLGGLDLLVFTGGIGEHSAEVRQSVLASLAMFGIRHDEALNQRGALRIDAPRSKVPIQVLPAEEDLRIAQHTRRLLKQT
jgi:acetate kinase